MPLLMYLGKRARVQSPELPDPFSEVPRGWLNQLQGCASPPICIGVIISSITSIISIIIIIIPIISMSVIIILH